MARTKVQRLQAHNTDLLPDAATKAFDKRLPQDVFLVIPLFLGNLVVRHGPVDPPRGSWECQSVGGAERQRGQADPGFKLFYDLVRICKLYHRELTSPLLYLFENTYSGERCTDAM